MEWILDGNIKDACKKGQFDFSMKTVLNGDRLFEVILANVNRKNSITHAL